MLCDAAADNSRKAYYKEFRKVVELSDVIIQVSNLLCWDSIICTAISHHSIVYTNGCFDCS
jgi:hypothetical protein